MRCDLLHNGSALFCNLCPCRYSKLNWANPYWLCFERETGPDTPQRSLPTSITGWFCEQVQSTTFPSLFVLKRQREDFSSISQKWSSAFQTYCSGLLLDRTAGLRAARGQRGKLGTAGFWRPKNKRIQKLSRCSSTKSTNFKSSLLRHFCFMSQRKEDSFHTVLSVGSNKSGAGLGWVGKIHWICGEYFGCNRLHMQWEKESTEIPDFFP